MNKTRRKELTDIIFKLHDEKENIEKLKSRLEYVLEDEESVMNNMPENLQESERYYTMEDNVNKMENALDELDSVVSELDDLIHELREIE